MAIGDLRRMSIYLTTRFYKEFNQQLISIHCNAGHLNFMLTRKEKDQLIKLLQTEQEGTIKND